MSGNGPTIGVHQDTHDELFQIKIELLAEGRKNIGMNDVVRHLLADHENSHLTGEK